MYSTANEGRGQENVDTSSESWLLNKQTLKVPSYELKTYRLLSSQTNSSNKQGGIHRMGPQIAGHATITSNYFMQKRSCVSWEPEGRHYVN